MRSGLRDGVEKVEGDDAWACGDRLGEGSRATEVGSWLVRELLEARRTRRAIGSVRDVVENLGKDGSRAIVLEEGASVGEDDERFGERNKGVWANVGELSGLENWSIEGDWGEVSESSDLGYCRLSESRGESGTGAGASPSIPSARP